MVGPPVDVGSVLVGDRGLSMPISVDSHSYADGLLSKLHITGLFFLREA